MRVDDSSPCPLLVWAPVRSELMMLVECDSSFPSFSSSDFFPFGRTSSTTCSIPPPAPDSPRASLWQLIVFDPVNGRGGDLSDRGSLVHPHLRALVPAPCGHLPRDVFSPSLPLLETLIRRSGQLCVHSVEMLSRH